MATSGTVLKVCFDALLQGFPTLGELEQFTLFELGENLSSIVGAANLSDSVFALLRWCDARGRLTELLTAAARVRPGNGAIQGALAQLQPAPVAPAKPPAPELPAPLRKRLREQIADLYDDPARLELVAVDLGLELASLDRSGPLGVVAGRVLSEVEKHDLVSALVRRVREDYPTNPALRTLAAELALVGFDTAP